MQDVVSSWSQVSANRALSYQWFANLLAAELSDEQLALYQGEQAGPILALFAQIGLESEAERVHKAIQAWDKPSYLRLELAADFAQMFLLDAKRAAVPYASVYLDNGQVYGSSEQLMHNILRDNQLEIPSDFKEPADHVAVILGVMAEWIRREQGHNTISPEWRQTVQFQHNFVEQMLLSFLPEFTRRSQAISVSYDFYPALCALLLAYVEADVEYLKSCLQDDSALAD